MSEITWAYGVTTVPSRFDSLLPKTLESLKAAGFDEPRLFVDGEPGECDYLQFGLPLTFREPNIGAFGNWQLGLLELFIRFPNHDRYAIFQDDILTYRNLRQYLDSVEYDEKRYWNLYSVPQNEGLGKNKKGWHTSNQRGRGALGIVLSNQAATDLLNVPRFMGHSQGTKYPMYNIDGAVVTSLRSIGYKEQTHAPSLLQHAGEEESSIQSVRGDGVKKTRHPVSRTFRGEDFDAMELHNE